MAALTWRNVDAPDFTPSMRGYETFSRLLDNAFKTASGGLDTFDAAQDENANTAVIAAAMRERDPEAYQKALATGLFTNGVDPKRINAATFGALNSQATLLLNQATQSQQLGELKRTTGQNVALDALAPEALNIQALKEAGDLQGAAKAQALLNEKLGAVGYRNASTVNKDIRDAEEFGVDIFGKREEQKFSKNRDTRDQTRLGLEVGRDAREGERFNWEITDRKEQRLGDAAALAVLSQSGNKEDALAAFSSPELTKLPAGARMRAMQRINESMGNIYTQDQLATQAGYSPAASVGVGTGAAGFDRVMNYEAANAGFGSVPASVKTLGQASDFAKQVNRAGVASSAMGAFQIVGQTMRNYGPKVFGADWQNKEFNLANQDKIAEAIFNDHKDSAAKLAGQWVSLSPAEAERVRKMPWSEARKVIAGKESSASPAQLGSPTTIIQGATLRRSAENVNKAPVDKILAAATQDLSTKEVVDQLRAGSFKGTDAGFLNRNIQDIVRRSRTKDGRYTINNAQAAEILKTALTESDGGSGSVIYDKLNNFIPGKGVRDSIFNANNSVRVNKEGWRLNNATIEEEIQRFKRGVISRDLDRENTRGTDVQSVQVAASNLASARAAYQSALMRVPTQPGVAANLPRLQARMAAAEQAYNVVAGTTEARNRPNAEPAPIIRKAAPKAETSIWDELGSLLTIKR